MESDNSNNKKKQEVLGARRCTKTMLQQGFANSYPTSSSAHLSTICETEAPLDTVSVTTSKAQPAKFVILLRTESAKTGRHVTGQIGDDSLLGHCALPFRVTYVCKQSILKLETMMVHLMSVCFSMLSVPKPFE